ncbi:hypothetical protein [Hyalangium rubrum]|uniref:Lipoprotein n=1 Tax=Hyalangium rubrum TaxID=3103134 RepID=A0ABU5H1T1_9BACT|nr:hypothetical protein [Hyalangium sp. s54d21]MDY7227276.1 hypothetical protein [Hyalangium sp. s54d21]
MREASRRLCQGLLLLVVAAACSHDSSGRWEDTGVRTKGGDSVTLRLQVLIAKGQLQQAEAMLVQALSAGLLSQETATRLRERIAAQKEVQEQEPSRLPPPISSEELQPLPQRRTCWTELPDHPVCQHLPEEYTFHSARQALEAMKQKLARKDLVLHAQEQAERGPCPDIGIHYNVRIQGRRAGSITCCPCCVEAESGPITWTKCRIVW